MNFKSVLMLVAGCTLMMCGCKDDKPQYGASMNIRILGVSGQANLSPGLKLGLYASEPVGAGNVQLTVTENGSVTPESELKWAYDQSQSSRFFVYAPYNGDYTGKESVEIDIPTDQTTNEKMQSCNILTGLASGAPNQSAVSIKLKHAMTAMVISFDNRSGEKIKSMYVTGIQTKAKLNLVTGSLIAVGGKSRITPMRADKDENTFIFLYVPQDATPVFNLTMSSGRTIAYTFDNSCHEYTGNIIKMTGIKIEEDTPDANILSLSGVNLTQWMTNGIPDISVLYPYVDLAGLGKVETDEDSYNLFEAYLKRVTITAVDKTDPSIYGLILEDESKAIHVWGYPGENLKKMNVGATITGRVLGYMEKPSKDEYRITYFYTYYSTFGEADTLPRTQGTFADLGKNIGDWEYRRMEFKNVTVKKSFEGDMAVFVQGEDTAIVVCPERESNLTPGTQGDLIGFPVRLGSEIQIMVYEPEQLESFTKTGIDSKYAVFASDSIYGFFDISNTDVAVNCLNGPNAELQYSFGYGNSARYTQFTDTKNGSSIFCFIYDCPELPVPGHEYKVAFNAHGNCELEGKTLFMECIKTEGNTSWFVDRVNNYGLRLAL